MSESFTAGRLGGLLEDLARIEVGEKTPTEPRVWGGVGWQAPGEVSHVSIRLDLLEEPWASGWGEHFTRGTGFWVLVSAERLLGRVKVSPLGAPGHFSRSSRGLRWVTPMGPDRGSGARVRRGRREQAR